MKRISVGIPVLLALTALVHGAAISQADPNLDALERYFRAKTEELEQNCLKDLGSLASWKERREVLREQLFEMLSLSPRPSRTELHPVITGTVTAEDFVVEKLHFQSMPGLYVTGSLYLPKNLTKPAPGILYVCGHAVVVTNGISYGNKVGYQHHGAWFARNGYVCLTIDTVQLGEIQGVHHGTHREGMWWWNSRGFTSAGVEAWNSIRALDYLQSRSEVDGDRLGVTGRSGGGAYSWWVAALDERVKVAAPVAGITDLRNHVVDGVVEGHCDCMYTVNTYRWDYPLVAALVAPRPLLICNSDKDYIFPLDGVARLHSKVKSVYKLYGATNELGLLITEGPHKDTQDLQLPVFRWFNRHLKREDPVIAMAATRFFTPQQLKVFEQLPSEEKTSTIYETFVSPAEQATPPDRAEKWAKQREGWKTALVERVFRGWPGESPAMNRKRVFQEGKGNESLEVYTFDGDENVPLRLCVVRGKGPLQRVQLAVGGDKEWRRWVKVLEQSFPAAQEFLPMTNLREPSSEVEPSEAISDGIAQVYFAPRGAGPHGWDVAERKFVQIRRRFMLLGQTLDGMRVWDIRRAIQLLQTIPELKELPITVAAEGSMGVNGLYAAIFEPAVRSLDLVDLPASHRTGPDYLNVMRFIDIPQAVAMAAEKVEVSIRNSDKEPWKYPLTLARNLDWKPTALRVIPK